MRKKLKANWRRIVIVVLLVATLVILWGEERFFQGYSLALLQPAHSSERVLRELITFPNAGFALRGEVLQPLHPSDREMLPGILLLHGTNPHGRQHFLYRVLAAALAEKGAVVFLFDQRGYGESPDPPIDASGRYQLDFPGDVARLLQYMAQHPQVDLEKLTIVGHSFGGSVVVGASGHSEVANLASRLVIISPGRGWPFHGKEKDSFRQRRLTGDMKLSQPIPLPQVREIFAPMEVENLSIKNPALEGVDIVLVNSEDEEPVKPLRPVFEKMTGQKDFYVIKGVDHYYGTREILRINDEVIGLIKKDALHDLVNIVFSK